MDASFYSSFIRKYNESADHADTLENLTVLTDLSRQKLSVLQHLTEEQLVSLALSLPHAQDSTAALLIMLKQNRDISLLPRIRQAFIRQLEQQGYEVITITTATADTETTALKKLFGNKGVLTQTVDPRLLAGIRVDTMNGSYEYSARIQLETIRQTISRNQKG